MNKFVLYLLSILFLISNTITAQVYPPDALWIYTKNPASWDTSKPVRHIYKRGAYHLFSPDTIYRDTIVTKVDNARGGMSHYNDSQGKILLYSNGYKIGNRYGDLIEGGGANLFDIPNNFESDDWTILHFGFSSSQSHLMLQDPGDSLVFHMIHIYHDIEYLTAQYIKGILNHTIIDMKDKDRRGVVIQKAKPLITEGVQSTMLTACQHANGTDWWISCRSIETNEFLYFLLNSEGLHFSHRAECTLGLEYDGKCMYSPDRRKMAIITQALPRGIPPKHMEFLLYEFDNATGHLELIENFIFEQQTRLLPGLEFSPDSRRLYFHDHYNLFTFEFDDPLNTLTFLDVIEYYQAAPPVHLYYGDLKISPDCRILITSNSGDRELTSIDFPNEDPANCMPNQRVLFNQSLYAGHFTNNPNLKSSEDMEDWCQEWGHFNRSRHEETKQRYVDKHIPWGWTEPYDPGLFDKTFRSDFIDQILNPDLIQNDQK